MLLTFNDLDLTPNPRREIGEKILTIGNSLLESVKNVPISNRAGFPEVLRNNNFALAVRVTKDYAFLEITTKARAPKSREAERLSVYRQFFTPLNSGERAVFTVDQSRVCRFGEMTLEADHAFSLGSDVSICIWNVRFISTIRNQRISKTIGALYVVGFGEKIREEEAWQEFDALIRLTLADWSAAR